MQQLWGEGVLWLELLSAQVRTQVRIVLLRPFVAVVYFVLGQGRWRCPWVAVAAVGSWMEIRGLAFLEPGVTWGGQ